MGKVLDLMGQKFGRLLVVSRAFSCGGHSQWVCVCDCGNEVIVRGTSLKSGNTLSCGCLHKENFNHKIHGRYGTRLYTIWRGIKSRCDNESLTAYGGKGIKMCDEWQNDFQAFYDWAILHGYEEHLTIDRIDNDKGYSPDNCRWATRKEQTKNRNITKKIVFNNNEFTLKNLSELTGINYSTLYRRIYTLGWDIEKALTTEVKQK